MNISNIFRVTSFLSIAAQLSKLYPLIFERFFPKECQIVCSYKSKTNCPIAVIFFCTFCICFCIQWLTSFSIEWTIFWRKENQLCFKHNSKIFFLSATLLNFSFFFNSRRAFKDRFFAIIWTLDTSPDVWIKHTEILKQLALIPAGSYLVSHLRQE